MPSYNAVLRRFPIFLRIHDNFNLRCPLFLPITKQRCTIKKLIFVFIVLFLAVGLHAQAASVSFHDFPWGTSLQDFKTKMGEPVHVDEFNGLVSLIYSNINISGYSVFMLAYFSQNGLEGGTYYFDTNSLDELRRCYVEVQTDLVAQYGPTPLFDGMLREMRPYETSWNLPDGYIYLKVNTRWNDPVSLWFSSPELTRRLRGS